MKQIARIMTAVFFLLLLSPRAFAFSVSYDQRVTVENNVVADIKVTVQDSLMWAESDFSGMKTVMLRNEGGAFSYMPDQKMATKIPAAMDRPNLTRDLPHFMDFLKQNAGEKIGSEKVEGRDCDIYKFTEPTIKKEAKAWVWTEKQFPIKIEVPAPEGLTRVELSNIQFDPKIDAAIFQIPADVKIIDFAEAQKSAVAIEKLQKTAAPDAPASPAPAK